MLHSSFSENKIEAGCDEAGRGCLAGPVVAAAVILPQDYKHVDLNDSKKLNKKQRKKIAKEIKRDAVSWAVAEVDNEEIDKINILNASFQAMHLAIHKLKRIPELLLIDGNRFNPYPNIPHECIIKGDGTYLSIAAASVLAKTHRDTLMKKFGKQYPEYRWKTNVGYPTLQHRSAIKNIGLSPLHRRSFRQLPGQLELFENSEEVE